MVKERKSRLDKGQASEFIGFGSFANSSTNNNTTTHQWSPVYTGSHESLRQVFARFQKRDETTLSKAVLEFNSFLESNTISKKQKAEGLQHFAYSYKSKLYLDNSGLVRNASYQVWKTAAEHLPKATSNLLDNHKELLGILYAARVDGDVLASDAMYDNHSDWDWKGGLQLYTADILLHVRPKALDKVLFPQRAGGAGLSEGQVEEMEERYVRIKGCCLDALALHVRTCPPNKMLNVESNEKLWWKSLSSNYSVLRKKTYLLVAAVAQHEMPNVQVPQILSSEKDAANWPTLLEMTLACLMKQSETNSRDPIVKALSKALAKGCYGSSVKTWGPILLPLLSKFPPDDQCTLLQAARNATVVTDLCQWELQRAISECSVYLLLRPDTNRLARPILDVWLRCLSFLLQHPTSHRTAQESRKSVCKELARQLVKFESVNDDKPCAFLEVRDWFWESGLNVLTEPSTGLGEFLEAVQSLENGGTLRTSPHLQTLFVKELKVYQTSSSDVPSRESYALFRSLFDFCDPQSLLQNVTLELFMFNDLLRWTILHTSSLSEFDQSNEFVQMDFGLLSSCLKAVSVDERSDLWDKFLREVIATKCHLGLLSSGLQALVSDQKDPTWIACRELDVFAEQVAEQQVSNHPRPSSRELIRFYQISLGIADGIQSAGIVSSNVILKWIELACSHEGQYGNVAPHSKILLEALLQGIRSERLASYGNYYSKILEQTWRSSKDLFEAYAFDILRRRGTLLEAFVGAAAKHLTSDISESTSSFDEEVWAEKAATLIHLCVREGSTSVPRIGLENLELWRKKPTKIYEAALSLFQSLDNATDRVSLLDNQPMSVSSLATVLDLLSEASSDYVQAASLRMRSDRGSQLLSALGGRDLDDSLKQSLFHSVLGSLRDTVHCDASDKVAKVRRHVSTLSLVVGLMLDPFSCEETDELGAESISEDDLVWYITDAAKPREREKALVAKVHHDAQAGYFFAITVERDGVSQERQTVIERLRSRDWSAQTESGVSPKDISNDESILRTKLRDEIQLKLDIPSAPSSTLSEVIAILVGHIGLGESRGIGSSHYEIHRALVTAQETCLSLLQNGHLSKAAYFLGAFSSALGFGLNVPPSRFVAFQILSDPLPLTNAIVDLGLDGVCSSDELGLAVLKWFVVSCRVANDKDRDSWIRFLTLVLHLIAKILEVDSNDGVAVTSSARVVACLACYEAIDFGTRRQMFSGDKSLALFSTLSASLMSAISRIAPFFVGVAAGWDCDKIMISKFSELVKLCIGHEDLQRLLGEHVRPFVGKLSTLLYNGAQRYSALLLIEAAISQWKPLDDDIGTTITLSDSTTMLLSEWVIDVEEEEASEIEEDVNIVAAWVPSEIMSQVESWIDNEIELLEEQSIVGQSLIWLTFLRCLEVAAKGEFRNRPAFVSYIMRCGALGTMLNISTLHADDLGARRRQSIVQFDAMMKDDTLLNESNVSALTLFRTVEVLPSLTRRWWDDECPKVYTKIVQEFVEKHVAPGILSSVLNRLKSSSSFGPMSVSASMVSRKVTATYVQDDFTLCVVITLPTAFPFRSAEVDCSKTLGVPKTRWKRWSMQIMLMLNNQGGSLYDALMLWKDNVDKEYAGVEPCPVCYSVLHVKTHKLPTLECTTCHNRFHADCLTQWFRSSGKSQCVLCQQPWHGTRV